MKKHLSRITILLAILTISIGVSYATWTPGAAPTSNIVPPPITALETDQIKPGALSVNTFATLGSGRLKQDALFAGDLTAVGTDPNLKFRIGGTNSELKTVTVDTTVSGSVLSGKTLGASELRNTTLKPLCTDGAGHIIFCDGSGSTAPTVGTVSVTKSGIRPSTTWVDIGGLGQEIYFNGATTKTYQVPVGTYNFTVRCDADESVKNKSERDMTFPRVYGTLPSPAIISVTAGQTSTIQVGCSCVFSNYSTPYCL